MGLAHLGLTAADDLITAGGKCTISLFTDISGAFASMWRRIVLPTAKGDEAFLRSLRAAGVEDHELHELYTDLVDISF